MAANWFNQLRQVYNDGRNQWRYTGSGSDGIVQPSNPTSMVNNGNTQMMLHEGELVGTNGAIVPKPATDFLLKRGFNAKSKSDQDKLRKLERDYGIRGYQTGKPLENPANNQTLYGSPSAAPQTQVGAPSATVQPAASTGIPQVTIPTDTQSVNTSTTGSATVSPVSGLSGTTGTKFSSTPYKSYSPLGQSAISTGLKTLTGIAQGDSSAFRNQADYLMNRQAAAGAAKMAGSRLEAAGSDMTTGGQKSFLSQVGRDIGAQSAQLAGQIATEGQQKAQSAAETLLREGQNLEQFGYEQSKDAKSDVWDQFNALIQAGGEDNIRAATSLFGTTFGVNMNPTDYIGKDTYARNKVAADTVQSMIETLPADSPMIDILGKQLGKFYSNMADSTGMNIRGTAFADEFETADDASKAAAAAYVGKDVNALTAQDYSQYMFDNMGSTTDDGKYVASDSKIFGAVFPGIANWLETDSGMQTLGELATLTPESGDAFDKLIGFVNGTTQLSDDELTKVGTDIGALMSAVFKDRNPTTGAGVKFSAKDKEVMKAYGYTPVNGTIEDVAEVSPVPKITEFDTSSVPPQFISDLSASLSNDKAKTFMTSTESKNAIPLRESYDKHVANIWGKIKNGDEVSIGGTPYLVVSNEKKMGDYWYRTRKTDNSKLDSYYGVYLMDKDGNLFSYVTYGGHSSGKLKDESPGTGAMTAITRNVTPTIAG